MAGPPPEKAGNRAPRPRKRAGSTHDQPPTPAAATPATEGERAQEPKGGSPQGVADDDAATSTARDDNENAGPITWSAADDDEARAPQPTEDPTAPPVDVLAEADEAERAAGRRRARRQNKVAREAELRAQIAAAIARTPDETHDFLQRAYDALLAEGFEPTPMQFRKRGQVFGVVKEHGHELQLHVRAFDNGVIESEVELSNKYIQHLWSPRRSAHMEIARVFDKHGVETDTINTEFRTRTGADRDRLPTMYTRTSDVVKGAVGIAGAVGAVAIARFIQKRGTNSKRTLWRGRRG